MGKKNLMYLVLSGIMATGVISTAKVEVASAATTKNTKIEQKQTKKYADMQSVLKIIENNYLKQNVDGTFYIEDIAKNAIDPEIVEFVTDGMEQMNNLIKSNQLEFKMTKKGNQKEITVTKAAVKKPSRVKRSGSSYGAILSDYDYCSEYKWFWWRFTCRVNEIGTGMIQNNLEEDLVLLGVTSSLTALVPGGAGLAAAMAAVGTKSIAASIKKCKNGILSKRGIYVAGLGKPATGNIVNLYMT